MRARSVHRTHIARRRRFLALCWNCLARLTCPFSSRIESVSPAAAAGDGLVAARHLWQFGYRPTCLYPKPTPRQLFTNLVEQCKQLDIEFLPSWAAAGDLGKKVDACLLKNVDHEM